jgi:NADH dehydrogenase
MSKRTIAVLGGTGFIGRHVLARLVRDGHDVIALTRSRERHRDLLVLPGLRLLECDPYDALDLHQALEGCDTVINLVGILNEKGRDGAGFRAAHGELTRRVVAVCNDRGIERFLHMSALRADAANGASHYLRSKGEAEDHIRQEAGAGLLWTIFRPSVVFGRGDGFIERFRSLLRTLPVLPLARPNARFAPVFVTDVATAVAHALDRAESAGVTYQLCGPRVYSLKELVTLIARWSGRRPKIIGLPDGLARMQAAMMDYVPGKPFSTDNFRSLTVHSICEKEAPGLRALDVQPTPLEAIAPAYLAPPHRVVPGTPGASASNRASSASRSDPGSSPSDSQRS